MISTALFGDGAAAAVLQAKPSSSAIAQIGASGEHLWPDTLDIMGWSVDPVGLGVPVMVQGTWGAPRIFPVALFTLFSPARHEPCTQTAASSAARLKVADILMRLHPERSLKRDPHHGGAAVRIVLLNERLTGGGVRAEPLWRLDPRCHRPAPARRARLNTSEKELDQ